VTSLESWAIDINLYRGFRRMVGKIRREISVESHPYTGLVLYEVSLDDLNQLEADTLTVGEDFSFALFAVTAAISFSVTLLTVDIPAGKLYEAFGMVTMLGYVGFVYFGIRWFRSRRRFNSTIRRIKERSGPLGEEGTEIDPQELESLSSAEATKP
jgi:hypothetical protein